MVENIGMWISIGIAIAAFILGILGSVASLFYKMGILSRRVEEHSEDLKEIQSVYVSGLHDMNIKLDKVLESVNHICQRVSSLEGRLRGEERDSPT